MAAWGFSPASAQVQAIQDAVASVEADSLLSDVERLVAFDTRFMGSDSNWAAVEWLEDCFQAMGYDVRRDSFVVDVSKSVLGQQFVLNDLTQVNLVASHRGVINPDRKIVLGAHYDSISLDRPQSEQDFAPGADDNATGVAAVLEIARLLRDRQTGMTVEFVLFGAEELGLVGSAAHAAAVSSRGEDVAAMIGLDVLGTRSDIVPDAFTLDTTAPYLDVANQVADAAEAYTDVFSRDGSSGSRLMVTSIGCRCSDHQSYLNNGIPAVGVFQYFTNPSPHINMSTDTIEQVDIAYVAEITRAILAGILDVAGFPRRSPDFDADGTVGFGDFLLFAEAFGTEMTDASTEAFDLDGDGQVAFSDFLIFSGSFGRSFT